MKSKSGGTEIPVNPDTLPPAGPPPDREVVAQIALNLARLNANPGGEENLDAIRADIENEGLPAYFHAAVQTIAAEEARQEQDAAAAEAAGVSFGIGFPGVPGDVGLNRKTWLDCIAARATQPLRVYYPTSLEELRSILQQAEAQNCRVKAVGSGHSFADVAGTRDFLVETHGFCQPTKEIDRSVLRTNARPKTLFETEAGITIRDLNEALWNANLGLENMGGYDAQTIAGVVSTSTHGSGLGYGPLSGQAVSLTVVAAGGRTLRVEPKNGITDPAAWNAKHPDIELVQDDDWYNACQVGIGCMGIIYSVVLRVKPRYFLHEERRLSDWLTVRAELRDGRPLRENDHYEVLVNPYSTLPGGNHTCLVTRRNPVPTPDTVGTAPRTRNILIEMASSVPGPSKLLLAALNLAPRLTPTIIDGAMKAIVGDYVDRSYRVYNIGAANEVPGYGSELAFPLSSHVEAVERILHITGMRQAVGQSYLNAPFSLRFVKESPAFMSMMQGTDTCMVELLSLDQTVGGKEILQELETQLYAFGGRPHWGLVNFLSGAGGRIEAMYPLYPRWDAVRRELDPNGRFANAFTERCGLTPVTFSR